MTQDLAHLREWIGRSERLEDFSSVTPVRALAATLDWQGAAPCEGDSLPPCWHWLYFLPVHAQAQIGPDGHPRRGGFLPPVSLPRRMWAGGRLKFLRPLRLGEHIERLSRIEDVTLKQGRSGPLVFVRVRHDISDAAGVAIVEEQDLVYRDPPAVGEAPPATQSAPTEATWRRRLQPDPVLLFRYSALTFNGHRIHYDRPYARDVEGYPGLVVHGPLLATLLLDLPRRQAPESRLTEFSFRAMKPSFDTSALEVCGHIEPDGKVVHLWAQHPDGALAMDARATLA